MDRLRPPSWFLPVFFIWFCAAVAVGALRLLEQGPEFLFVVVMWSLTLLTLLVAFLNKRVREWWYEVDLRLLIALHVSRFVGFAFLMYGSKGLLPKEWAETAGYGDIAVAATALGAIAVLSFPQRRFPRSAILWNLFGFAEILHVLYGGMQYVRTHAAPPAEMLKLPMSLLPTFLVPLILATHVMIFVRCWREIRIEKAADEG
jgi:hypothetical protein